jgi:hypothetical protein
VSFNVKRSWDGVLTSTAQLDFTLLAPVMPDNMTDVIDRTPPKPDAEDKKEDANSEGLIIFVVVAACITAIIVALLATDKRKRKKVSQAATNAASKASGMVKTIAYPIWQTYKTPIATIIIGAVLFLGGLGWQMYSPFKIFPLNAGIFGFTLLSTSWEALISILLGILFLVLGISTLIFSGIMHPAIQNNPIKTATTKLLKSIRKKRKK